MDEGTRYVGLDVHKASISVAVAGPYGEPEDHGTIANDASSVRHLLQRLGDRGRRLAVAYEAGPTGYALHRQVTAMGIGRIVVAPSLIPVRPGERIKTDRRDAAKLARLLRSGDLVALWVPDEAGEALRDLVRAGRRQGRPAARPAPPLEVPAAASAASARRRPRLEPGP